MTYEEMSRNVESAIRIWHSGNIATKEAMRVNKLPIVQITCKQSLAIDENERKFWMEIYEECLDRMQDIDYLKEKFYDLKASGMVLIGDYEYDIEQTFQKYYALLDSYEHRKTYHSIRDKLLRFINTIQEKTIRYDRVA